MKIELGTSSIISSLPTSTPPGKSILSIIAAPWTLGLGVTLSSCIFQPPPPLPEELAEAEAVTQVALTTQRGGNKATRGKEGSGDNPNTGGPDSDKAGNVPSSKSASALDSDAESFGESSAEGEAAAENSEESKGEPPRVGMTLEEIQAFNKQQGDPFFSGFPLKQALEGVEGQGKLWIELKTTQGKIACQLFEEQAPRTVANFVGLARGVRPFFDRNRQSWTTADYLNGSEFHRVIPGFMIQGGDPSATGMGNPGYVIVDEIVEDLEFNRPGLLAMANRGPSTGGSQFFITLAPVPHLNQLHTIFGECSESSIKVAESIASVPRGDMDRPTEAQEILSIEVIRR